MKKQSLVKSAFIAVISGLLMTGCFSERIESLDARPADPIIIGSVLDHVNITTGAPDVSKTNTVFKGRIKMEENKEVRVTYGFFWYDPNNEYSTQNPNRIEVGVASASLDFTSDGLRDLPREKELIVCAFVERDNNAEMNVGDEVPFVVPKP